MKRTRLWFCLAGLLVIAGLGVWHRVYEDPFHNTLERQQIRMQAAREHLPALVPRVTADPAFSKVTCQVYTASGGSLLVSGEIADEATFDRLRALVAATHPPVAVVYLLHSAEDSFSAEVAP